MTHHEAWLRSQLIRIRRTTKGLMAVTRRHVPKWLAAIITIALLIPGPQDELLVLIIIGVYAAFKPAMRKDFATTTREAWSIYA